MTVDRKNRIIRTLKQAAIGAVITAGLAILGNVSDVTSVEFGNQTWYPIAQMLFTGLAAFLMNLKRENGGEDPK